MVVGKVLYTCCQFTSKCTRPNCRWLPTPLMSVCSVRCNRTVGGSVGYGDARGPACGQQPGDPVPGAGIWPVCCTNGDHPAGDGGSLCLSPCSPVALVR